MYRLYLLLLFVFESSLCHAQQCRYLVQIEINKAYISGICIMANEENKIKATIFNEFGVTTFSFEYQKDKEQINITHIERSINRRRIKRELKKDLKAIMQKLPGNVVVENKKNKIKYTFTPLNNETSE